MWIISKDPFNSRKFKALSKSAGLHLKTRESKLGAVCLTGDFHHISVRTRDKSLSKNMEVEVDKEYLAIAENYCIKVTLFITGKSFVEENYSLKTISWKELMLYRGLLK